MIVRTQSGPVQGTRHKGASVWRGIPYAQADRFMAPRDPEPWSDALACATFGAKCVQNITASMKQARFTEPSHSENCLFLNVFAPETLPDTPCPVLVWIHGGAFLAGSADIFDGSQFAREHGIVVVTLNYRLGVLGFGNFSHLMPEAGFSSNPGFRDQIKALDWVQRNIAAFGGDPARVTLAGESAGGTSVSYHLLSSASKGLFHRAIVQSGSFGYTMPRAISERVGARFLKLLGVAPGDTDALLAQSPEALMQAQTTIAGEQYVGYSVTPWFDGDVLPASLDDATTAPTHPMPMIAGATREESRFFELPPIGDVFPLRRADLTYLLQDRFGSARASDILGAYPDTKTGNRALATDLIFRMPTHHLAERHSANAPTWVYSFDHRHPVGGACHALDNAYLWPMTGLFGLIVRGGFDVGRNARVARKMRRLWAAFVKGSLPAEDWPEFNLETRKVLSIKDRDAILIDPFQHERAVWRMQDSGTFIPDSMTDV